MTDRRTHHRVHSPLPCKLFLYGRGRYVAGTIADLSTGGVLVRLAQTTPIEPGQRVVVGIPAADSPGLIRRERMREATVVRVSERGSGQLLEVGLQFIEALPMVTDAAPTVNRRAA